MTKRWPWMVAAVVLLGMATAVEAQVTPTKITCGSSFGTDPKYLDVTVAGSFALMVPPWVVASQTSGVAPIRLALRCDKSGLTPKHEETQTLPLVVLADGITSTYPITWRATCSTSSGCGTGSPVPPPPTARPTIVRTATPLPGQPTATTTPQPTFTSVGGSTPVRTATAIRTATATVMVPTRTATAAVPTVQPTSVPPSGRPVAQPGRALTVVRPMPYRFVSYRNDFAKPRKWAYFLDGTVTTADNASMDAQEHVRLSGVQELTALLDDWRFLDCFDEVQETIAVSQGISHIYRDLMGPYQVAGKLNDGVKGTWADEDAYYNIAGYSMRRYRRCLLGKAMVAVCASLPTEYLEFLDLRSEGGKCVEGAAFTLPFPPATVDKAQQNLGPLTADHLMPAYSAAQLALLNDSTSAHTCASLAVGDGRACPGGTQEKLRRFEQSGVNAEQRHAMQLAPFPKGDKRWPHREHTAIALGELYTWGDGSGTMPLSWDGQQRGQGNWGLSRGAEFAHLIYHAIAAHMWVREYQGTWVDRSPPYLYRFPCKVNGKFTYGNDCPEESQAQIVNRALRGDYGIYTPGRH